MTLEKHCRCGYEFANCSFTFCPLCGKKRRVPKQRKVVAVARRAEKMVLYPVERCDWCLKALGPKQARCDFCWSPRNYQGIRYLDFLKALRRFCQPSPQESKPLSHVRLYTLPRQGERPPA